MQQAPVDPFDDQQTIEWRRAHGLGDLDALRQAHQRHLDRLRTAAAAEGLSADALAGAVRLATVLAPYRWRIEAAEPDAAVFEVWFWRDCPPTVVRQALALVDDSMRSGRPNGQPSAEWLLEQADAHGGWLAGAVIPLRQSLRVDSIQVPTEARSHLLSALQALPTPPAESISAVDLAVAEAWSSLQDQKPIWVGKASALLTDPVIERSVCVGLWWD